MDLAHAKGETIGHLGLIASVMKDVCLKEKIDDQLGKVEGGLSYGVRVGGMILNGLGFINTALYLTPRFFHDKPIDLLLGEGVKAEQLNDDSLGRCLDKIAGYGPTKWYSEIALSVVEKSGLLSRVNHLDSTTLTLYGSYEGFIDQAGVPSPKFGYSKDHRPDLKQVTLQCVNLGKAGLPIWMEALDGNSSDKKSFPETVKRVDAFYKEVKQAPKMCFIADSALYGKALNELEVDWLTRVPENYKKAKELCEQLDVNWIDTSDVRYKTFSYIPENNGERWLLIRSEPAFNRENKTFENRHEKAFEELEKRIWHTSCQTFGCEQDARKSMEKAICASKHFYIVNYEIIQAAQYKQKGRPKAGQEPDHFRYQIRVLGIASDLDRVVKKRQTLGRFVLATNVLDKEELSDESMLFEYKEQCEIERGFRFIKNDTFGLDEVYLKKPERIGALMAIMTLCLFIYGLAQYRLREVLKTENEVLPDQKKKPTQTPTLLWIFTLFSAVIMVNLQSHAEVGGKRIVLNLHPVHKKIILLFGEQARKIYLLPEGLKLHDIVLNQKSWLQWCGI